MVVAKLATSGCFVFTIERQSRQSEDCSALTKMMQFNQVFYFVMTKDTRKQLRVILYNKVFNDAIRIVDKLISVDTLGLYVNEPKYFEEELNSGKGRTKIMFEMTFLRNNYIENSIGTVKIELANF
jgi:negative regulator of replication initiation